MVALAVAALGWVVNVQEDIMALPPLVEWHRGRKPGKTKADNQRYKSMDP